MGEFARYQGDTIKIGTCEEMYYLRADQAHKVMPLPQNVNPVTDREAIRFRFPFPDEDGKEPGDFNDPFRSVRVDGAREVLRKFDPASHDSVQFKADGGYLVSLPCPELAAADQTFKAASGILTLTNGTEYPYQVGRNGFRGALFVVQQRYAGDVLTTIVQCACGAKWRLATFADAEPVIVALRSMADLEERRGCCTQCGKDALRHAPDDGHGFGVPRLATFYHDMADRITAGYKAAVPA